MSATLIMGKDRQEKEDKYIEEDRSNLKSDLAKVGITFKKQENIMFEFKNIYLSIKYRFIFFSLHSEFSKTTFYPKSKSVLESCFSKGGEET